MQTSEFRSISRLPAHLAWVFSVFAFSLLIVPANCLADGNPDLVGVLAAITDPSTAAELGLSEDQIDRLKALIKQHESQALEFASQVRSLEAAERREKMFQNLRDVERRGYALLNEAQRTRAEQIRLKNLGLSALSDPEVAALIALNETQVAKIRTVVEGRRAVLREMGPEKGAAEIEKRISEILDESQRSQWSQMIGPVAAPSTAATGVTSPSDANVGSSAPQLTGNAMPSDLMVAGPPDGLRINFNATPWSDVLKWLAKEAELSLQSDSYPPGTFTYRDPYRTYSLSKTMDIMNSVLLGKGYTLVRKERVLMAVDLGSGESAEIIRGLVRELAELVPADELENRGEFEICKSLFKLERVNVEDAEKEVKLLLGPHGSIVPMPSANQLLVTETGGKLRIIRDTIKRAETPEAGRGAKIVTIALHHVSADEVLGVARPLLGLKDGSNISDDLSVSTDTFGNTIYATGTADKLQKLKDLTTQIDVKPSETSNTATTSEQPVVRRHELLGSDPATTMDVLQTMFAGQTNINLALDPKTNNIIARATVSDHKLIENLIAEVAGQSSDFEVITLGKMDVSAAILTLEKFFGKQSSKDKDAGTAKGPIFYGDTVSRRIMVKGTKEEVDKIKELLSKVEDSGPTIEGLGDGIRILPYSGKSADRMLNQIDLLWQATKRKGRIREVLPKGATPAARPERAVDRDKSSRFNGRALPEDESSAKHNDDTQPKRPEEPMVSRSVPNDATLTGSNTAVRFTAAQESQPGDSLRVRSTSAAKPNESPTTSADDESSLGEIKVYRGPTGLVITSDDPKMLQDFDQVLKVAQEQMSAGPSEPTVIYLQYITAVAAEELIRGIIAGESAASSGGGSLLGDVASSVMGGGGIFGMLGMGGGGNTISSGDGASSIEVSITADPRLNALWVQANPIDLMMVEQLVEIIDTPESPVSIDTRGTPQIIYLESVSVTEVEATVKQVFADQMTQSASSAAQRQPSPQEFIEALRGGGGGNRKSGPKELKEQTMSITADKKNNALIVMAPPKLFQKVEALVKLMDQTAADSEDSVMVVPIEGNVAIVQSALASVFGSSAKTSSTSGSTSTSAGSSSAGAPQPTAPQGVPDMMQQFRNRGGGGGGMGAFPFGGGQGRGGQGAGGFPFGGFGGQGFGNRGQGQGQGQGQGGQGRGNRRQ